MSNTKAADWINHLQLIKHIEGGWYSEVYHSSLILEKENFPVILNGNRHCCTHIYFLLQQHEFSAFHRIRSDELWHFYDGDNLFVYEIDHAGRLTEHKLGKDISNGFLPFCVVKSGSWFASRVAGNGQYALAGCTVSPGFDYDDFELAKAAELLSKYPAHKTLIQSLCRQ